MIKRYPDDNKILRVDKTILKDQLECLKESLNERDYRRVLGALSNSIGYGGQQAVHELTGAAYNTVRDGRREMEALQNGTLKAEETGGRIRNEGGGRKALTELYPNLPKEVERIVEESTYGNPENVLKWTTLSLEKISQELHKRGIPAGRNVVARTLTDLGFSRQQNQKQLQVGKPHPDRDGQFRFISNTVEEPIARGMPAVSIDAKTKELLGNFKNNGSEYRRKEDPRRVLDHDFEIKELGHVAPYGIYDLDKNTSFINLGTSRDTAEFSVNSLYQWWLHCGRPTYPDATRLLVTCDGGGSNGSRLHLWKAELAAFAQLTGLEVQVAHFPPGTSKWNKIEHRVFCYISKNWQGQPLIDIETVVQLIGSPTTSSGLQIECRTDYNIYPTGIKVSDEEYDDIDIERIEPYGDWNYIIRGFKSERSRPLGATLRAPAADDSEGK